MRVRFIFSQPRLLCRPGRVNPGRSDSCLRRDGGGDVQSISPSLPRCVVTQGTRDNSEISSIFDAGRQNVSCAPVRGVLTESWGRASSGTEGAGSRTPMLRPGALPASQGSRGPPAADAPVLLRSEPAVYSALRTAEGGSAPAERGERTHKTQRRPDDVLAFSVSAPSSPPLVLGLAVVFAVDRETPTCVRVGRRGRAARSHRGERSPAGSPTPFETSRGRVKVVLTACASFSRENVPRGSRERADSQPHSPTPSWAAGAPGPSCPHRAKAVGGWGAGPRARELCLPVPAALVFLKFKTELIIVTRHFQDDGSVAPSIQGVPNGDCYCYY